jgi:hypothetical protein
MGLKKSCHTYIIGFTFPSYCVFVFLSALKVGVDVSYYAPTAPIFSRLKLLLLPVDSEAMSSARPA